MTGKGLTFLIFISFYQGLYAQDCQITERILPVVKKIGLKAELTCVVVDQKTTDKVLWIKWDGKVISKDKDIDVDEIDNQVKNGQLKYDIRSSKMDKKNTYILIINNLERKDGGNYTCKIESDGETRTASVKGELKVLTPPSIDQSGTTHTVSVKEGDEVTLECTADGNPKPNITWVRVNGASLSGGTLRHKGEKFTISKVTMRDRGIFRCLADNSVNPPSSYDTTVFVDFKPIVIPVQTSYGQAPNRNFRVIIECKISGYPEPDLRWYKKQSNTNKQQILNDDYYAVNILLNHANYLNPHERWFQLIINPVDSSHFGTYICEGCNSYGCGENHVKLFETSECQGPVCPAEDGARRSAVKTIQESKSLIFIFYLLIIIKDTLM